MLWPRRSIGTTSISRCPLYTHGPLAGIHYNCTLPWTLVQYYPPWTGVHLYPYCPWTEVQLYPYIPSLAGAPSLPGVQYHTGIPSHSGERDTGYHYP
jgi:hypothetical protein